MKQINLIGEETLVEEARPFANAKSGKISLKDLFSIENGFLPAKPGASHVGDIDENHVIHYRHPNFEVTYKPEGLFLSGKYKIKVEPEYKVNLFEFINAIFLLVWKPIQQNMLFKFKKPLEKF